MPDPSGKWTVVTEQGPGTGHDTYAHVFRDDDGLLRYLQFEVVQQNGGTPCRRTIDEGALQGTPASGSFFVASEKGHPGTLFFDSGRWHWTEGSTGNAGRLEEGWPAEMDAPRCE